jgi:predicted nuclease of predicted toxin-antitoxin system
MRFLADMGVSGRVVEWLRSQGHDATHLREEGLHRLPNGGIFDKAAAEERVVLTFDLDFSEIAALAPEKVTSVISFRLRNTTTENVIARLSSVLDASSEQIKAGCVVSVEDTRHRVRSLPIGSE